jgi:hypothetical protein
MSRSACDVTLSNLSRNHFVAPQPVWGRGNQDIFVAQQANVGCERIKYKFAFKSAILLFLPLQ